MFSCVFVTYRCGVLGQVWYWIVSIPEICLLPYFGLQCVIWYFLIILACIFKKELKNNKTKSTNFYPPTKGYLRER